MTDDLISRKAAIDALGERPLIWSDEDEFALGERSQYDSDKLAIETMPSADVVPVVRCKECRWWDQKDDSPYGYCHAAKHAYYSAHWEIGIYRTYKPDWFCADGERKDDANDK